jgi:sugar lactone lactonase YvrE
VFVADTGNKRIVIFDRDGNYLNEFGSGGVDLGQLDEPVALAIGSTGLVYVTDTWNQRVQVFTPDATGLVYTSTAAWPVEGWYGNSLENKPFVVVDGGGNVSVTDPELCRVIEFSSDGQAKRVWDGCSAGGFARPSGILSDGSNGLWVTDAQNGTVVHFKAEIP